MVRRRDEPGAAGGQLGVDAPDLVHLEADVRAAEIVDLGHLLHARRVEPDQFEPDPIEHEESHLEVRAGHAGDPFGARAVEPEPSLEGESEALVEGRGHVEVPDRESDVVDPEHALHRQASPLRSGLAVGQPTAQRRGGIATRAMVSRGPLPYSTTGHLTTVT